ncbi:MAG TPA: hypothetical protein VNT81_22915 [Vicinamibacterales bacterium]|nr:hypothetical protein [Vicinamibacterales bacterium]
MMTMPLQSEHVPAKPEVRFIEGTEGTVQAIRAWWYPGTSTGFEFVYPREQAMRLAERARTSVLTTANTAASAEGAKASEPTRVSSSDEVPPRSSEPIKEAPMMFDVPPATVPPLPDGASPLTPWLGALSLAMGTVANRGPQLRT